MDERYRILAINFKASSHQDGNEFIALKLVQRSYKEWMKKREPNTVYQPQETVGATTNRRPTQGNSLVKSLGGDENQKQSVIKSLVETTN
jgi:hypothetical protein